MGMTLQLRRSAAVLGPGALLLTTLALGSFAPAQAMTTGDVSRDCVVADAHGHDEAAAARGGERVRDHRAIDALEQERIERDFQRRLEQESLEQERLEQERRPGARAVGATVPVYVHVMRDANGGGDVTDSQIAQQIAVMNTSFSGGKSTEAADTGFQFTLAGVDRFNNTQWHQDKQSATYRKQTRKGGANALNIWLVDFDYLGIATFPWDYKRNPGIDGIRVQYTSLPGGAATNYNLGETATHEAGHWFGLYHTFQGGCTSTNDEVGDTPAQSSSTTGCPEGRDSCTLPGLDPIHNFMDYSYDSCYTMFTAGQATRSQQMWTAYRG